MLDKNKSMYNLYQNYKISKNELEEIIKTLQEEEVIK